MVKTILKTFNWRYRDFLFNMRVLDLSSFMMYYISLFTRKKYTRVSVKGVDRKFVIRTNNKIDRNVLDYVFFKKYHLPPEEVVLKSNPVIVDLGANIGCTIVDFKLNYPDAVVIGYEIHPENFSLAVKNSAGLDSVIVRNKAVWTEKGTVSFGVGNFTDAFFINKNFTVSKDEMIVPSIGMFDIFTENNLVSIDYLKMDIEGAENDILSVSDLSWLNKVHSMNIEFHNIPKANLENYISLFERFGFTAYKSPHHWMTIIAHRAPA